MLKPAKRRVDAVTAWRSSSTSASSSRLGDAQLTGDLSVIGTLAYMSPEAIARGERD